MRLLSAISLKLVRWTGWLLVPVVLAIFSGERAALAFHKLMHLPLAVLAIAHVAASAYLAMIRWGWIRQRPAA
jgi:hypothetical protein